MYACTTMFFATVFGLLLLLLINNFFFPDSRSKPALLAAFGPPLFLLVLVLAAYIEVAVAGGWYSEHEREWRSRLGAWLLIFAVWWAAVFATMIYLPHLLDNSGGTASAGGVAALAAVLRFLLPKLTDRPSYLVWAVVRIVPLVFLVAVLALVASGVDRLVERIERPSPEQPVPLAPAAGGRAFIEGQTLPIDRFQAFGARQTRPIDRLQAFGAAAGGIGLATRVSSAMILEDERATFVPLPLSSSKWSYAERLERNGGGTLLVVAGIALILVSVFILVVPVNRFSLHSMYANRLIRCYLGASQRPPNTRRFSIPTAVVRERNADTFSQLDPDDDLPLVRLRGQQVRPPKMAAPPWRADDESAPYYGPFPLFNATLNMVADSGLAFQDRRGESFVLTPGYCGSDSTGFARLNGPDVRIDERLSDQTGAYWNLTVGRAVTISGAAVDPNMANYYSEQFTAFLTILNARLGWWLRNPMRAGSGVWDATPPGGSCQYVRELLSLTDATSPNVHLSDGGHYEVTGAYELIRRRCRFVLLVDAAENPDNTSENLANLIRLVQSDFGIRIHIDTAPLKRDGDRQSLWHCAIGAIRYDDVDEGGVIGTLLFVRSSMTGDEPADIKNYAAVTPVFPHHPTADQFFDAAQFESYRGLGYHIGMSVLAEAAVATRAHTSQVHRFNRQLFSRLRRQWTPTSAAFREAYAQSCVDSLREGERPKERTDEPPVDARDPRAGDERAIVRRIQLMELAWLRNDLSRNYAHPVLRGWVNTFRKWSSEVPFQRLWAEVRSEFSQDFVCFCERALNVNRPSVLLVPVSLVSASLDKSPDWTAMRGEFGEEFMPYLKDAWAGRPAPAVPRMPGGEFSNYLEEVKKAKGECWLITYGDPEQDDRILTGSQSGKVRHVVGFVAKFDPVISNGTPAVARELLLWFRGSYRMAGVGGTVMRVLRKAGEFKKPKLPGPLFARLPRIGGGSAEQLQRAMWVQFLNDFDFYGVPPTGAAWEEKEIRVAYKG